MHAYGVTNIECLAATASTTAAACACQRIPQKISPDFPIATASYLPTRRPTVPRLTVSRATVSNNGSGYPRQTVRSDRDGTLGPQSRVPADDMVALSSSAPRPPPLPSALRSYDVPLWDAMKFVGPAPEIINGRLAMLGIIAAAVNEAKYSETVAQQVPHVALGLVLMTLIVSYSSLVPILKGAKSEAFGPFTPRAEITNGRAAMLGFAILIVLENKSGVPFF